MKPIVFLDFDGGLNSVGSVYAFGSSLKHWCPTACALVAKLVEKLDAEIVISSSWRIRHHIDDLCHLLAACRLQYDRVIDVTPMLDALLGKNNPEFRKAVETLPDTYWGRYDLSACRVGWELAMARQRE